MLSTLNELGLWCAFGLWTLLACSAAATLAYRSGWRDGVRAQRDAAGRTEVTRADPPPYDPTPRRANRNMWE